MCVYTKMDRLTEQKEANNMSYLDTPYIPKFGTATVDPHNKALRYNQGKVKWSLVHFRSLEPMVKVLMYGADKYAVDNWKHGLDRKEILESMMRHVTALIDGEEYDPESTEHHIGHIMCNCMFYSYFNIKEVKDEPGSKS